MLKYASKLFYDDLRFDIEIYNSLISDYGSP